MRKDTKRIEFNHKEALNGQRTTTLPGWGLFYGDFVNAEERTIYGWLVPTKQKFEELNLKPGEVAYPCVVHYVPENEKEEKHLLHCIRTGEEWIWAHRSLFMWWKTFDVELRDWTKEVYTVKVTEEEQLKGWNHADLGEDGDFYAELAEIEVTGMSDDDEITRVTLQGIFEDVDGEREEATMNVLLSNGQFYVKQLREKELMLSDIVNAGWDFWDLL